MLIKFGQIFHHNSGHGLLWLLLRTGHSSAKFSLLLLLLRLLIAFQYQVVVRSVVGEHSLTGLKDQLLRLLRTSGHQNKIIQRPAMRLWWRLLRQRWKVVVLLQHLLHLLGMMMRLTRRRRWWLLLRITHEAWVRGALVLRLMGWTAAIAVVVKLWQRRRSLLRMMGQRVWQAIQRKV